LSVCWGNPTLSANFLTTPFVVKSISYFILLFNSGAFIKILFRFIGLFRNASIFAGIFNLKTGTKI
jgi:hypothetical protein